MTRLSDSAEAIFARKKGLSTWLALQRPLSVLREAISVIRIGIADGRQLSRDLVARGGHGSGTATINLSDRFNPSGVARVVKDADCVDFLQWALPRLDMCWQGFRRVRRQVCRRLQRRLSELQLDDLVQYQHLLSGDEAQAEWERLDALCRVSISRFYRDREVFRRIQQKLLPCVQHRALAEGRRRLRIWSIGCASGEEPYTLALMGAFDPVLSRCELDILATDTDPRLLERARRACYPPSSLRELPQAWWVAFEACGGEFCLRSDLRKAVRFVEQDIRQCCVEGTFDMILCRNLVFTYFVSSLQKEIARFLAHALVPGGYLVLGTHESLPEAQPPLEPTGSWLYRRRVA